MNSVRFEDSTPRESQPKISGDHIRQATMHLAQAKLYFCRARLVLPGDRPRTKRVVESLASALQFAIESADRLGVSR
jgi:hypothetical protein